MEKRPAERIIVFVYSVYALALMFATTILGWPGWITPITTVGIVVAWIVYLRGVRDYRFRALLYSAVVLATFALYNMQEDSFGGILTTYCAAVVVLSILDIPEIVFPEYLCSVLLIAYHAFISNNLPLGTTQEKIRSAVQIISVFAVVAITHHRIKKNGNSSRHMQEVISELEATERSKVDFLAKAFGELKAPVDVVCASGELILREELPRRAREEMLNVQTAGRDLLSMIRDVLDFTEIESGRMELVEEPYHLTSTINDVINMALAYQGSKDLELIVECDTGIPSVLLGDERQLRRVILNLVNNAMKFTEEGCVTIVVSARPEQYGVNLCVKVIDTGVGIPEEKLERLFNAMEHVKEKPGPKQGGIGIGLAAAKKIVQKMNGFISVRSEPGKGSEFQFVVPQRVADPRPIVTVRGAEAMNVLFYINTEKTSMDRIRDHYMSSICHMMDGLEIRYHQCRNLGELKRRAERENYTHALITGEEYREDAAYFDRLSHQVKVIMIRDGRSSPAPGGNITLLQKPFYALSFAAVLNGAGVQPGEDGADRPAAEKPGERPPEKRPQIDRGKGMKHLGGHPEDYRDVLRVYLEEGRRVQRKLRERFLAEDWKNYVIYVHSLKSNSFSIGADRLGEQAKALEAAGKEGDAEYIRAHHEELMELFEEVLLEVADEVGEGQPRPEAPAEGRDPACSES